MKIIKILPLLLLISSGIALAQNGMNSAIPLARLEEERWEVILNGGKNLFPLLQEVTRPHFEGRRYKGYVKKLGRFYVYREDTELDFWGPVWSKYGNESPLGSFFLAQIYSALSNPDRLSKEENTAKISDGAGFSKKINITTVRVDDVWGGKITEMNFVSQEAAERFQNAVKDTTAKIYIKKRNFKR